MNPGFLYAGAAAVIWGLVYAIDQRILTGVSPLTLVFIDGLLTTVFLLPFLFSMTRSLKITLPSGALNWSLIILALVLSIVANYSIFYGIKLVGASSASIIEIAYPFFVVFFSFILFRAVPNLSFAIGGILIFIGSAIITYFH